MRGQCTNVTNQLASLSTELFHQIQILRPNNQRPNINKTHGIILHTYLALQLFHQVMFVL